MFYSKTVSITPPPAFILMLAILAIGSGAAAYAGTETSQRHQDISTSDYFEAEGLLGKRELVIVRAMVEDKNTLYLRAIQAKVAPSSLKPKAYGLSVYVLFNDPLIGHAFLHKKQIYHLGKDDRLIIDQTYYYCNGFVSNDILKITERSWSEYHKAGTADIQKLDMLAKAVQNGTGQQEAYDELGILGSLAKHGGTNEHKTDREFTWFVGKQDITEVQIELMRSNEYGNRITTKFVR